MSVLLTPIWSNTRASIRSARPLPYTSALSKWFTPASTAALMPAATSASSTSAHPFGLPLTQFRPPRVQQPKLISDTLTSVWPSLR